MGVEIESFVIASFALWAGDIDYAASLLSEYAAGTSLPDLEGIYEPEQVLRAAAATRLQEIRALRELRGDPENPTPSSRPPVLKTAHLRGVVWQTNEREFQLKAYLSSLSWETSLFDNAGTVSLAASGDSQAPLPTRSPAHRESGARSAAWVVTGNPFIRVYLGEMGLLQANALWTLRRTPDNLEAILDALQRVLASLDSGAGG
jgi:hypothetical protein